MEKPQYGIFLKVDLERGFNTREVEILFGKDKRLNEVVESSRVMNYEGQSIFPVSLKSYVQGKNTSIIQMETIGGLRELTVPKEQVMILDRRKTIIDRRASSRTNGFGHQRRASLDDRLPSFPPGTYLEVIHYDEPTKRLPTVSFGRKGAYTEKVYVDDLITTDRKYGLLRVDLKSEIGADKDSEVNVELRATKKGRVIYSIPARYIKQIGNDSNSKN